MGKKSTPPPPPTPDYRGAAEQQAQSNQQAQTRADFANRPTINTPWGQQTWNTSAGVDPATGQPVTNWTQNITLDPRQQRALDQQMGLQEGRNRLANSFMGRVEESYGTPFSTQGFTPFGSAPQANTPQTSIGGSGQYSSQAGDALYRQAQSRLDPQFQQRSSDLESSLVNKGIARGSNAWNREMGNLDRARTDAYNDAGFRASQLAGAEASRMQGMDLNAGNFANAAGAQRFGQDLQSANYQNTLRQQQFAEEAQRRGMSLNEMNALMSGQQVGMPQMPNFNTSTSAGGTNYFGAATQGFNAGMANYNAGQQQQNNLFGNLGGIAQIGSMFMSDARLKTGVEPFGVTPRGSRVYLYRFKGSKALQIGVLAQEVPHAAVQRGDFLAVDYSKV